MFGKLSELFVRVGMDGTDRVKVGMGTIGQVTDATAEKLRRAGGVFSWFGGMAARGFEIAKNAAIGFSVASAATLGIVGKEAVTASVNYASLVARLEAVTGAAESAGRKLKFVQEVAGPSNFTFTQLAEATTTLEAFGINAERVLPTVARLGMAFGADNDKLQMLVRGLGDISAGGFLEKDVAASFGLTRSMFEVKGIQFDGQGQLKSGAKETMQALEDIVNERYGGIFDKMGDTASAKLASLDDLWEKALRNIGDHLMKGIGPAVGHVSNILDGAIDTGVLNAMLDRTSSGIERLWLQVTGGTDVFDGITRAIAGTMSVIEHLPDQILNTVYYLPKLWAAAKQDVLGFGQYIGDVFATAWGNATSIFQWHMDRISGIFDSVANTIQQTWRSMWEVISAPGKSLSRFLEKPTMDNASRFGHDVNEFLNAPFTGDNPVKMFRESLAEQLKMHDKPYPELMKFPEWTKTRDGKDRFTALPNAPKNILFDSFDEYYEKLTSGRKNAAGKQFGVPAGTGDFFSRDVGSKAEELLDSIEKNTKKATEILSLRREALGGGPLGALGITPAEYYSGIRAPDYQPMPLPRFERSPMPTGQGGRIGSEIEKAIARESLMQTTRALLGGGRYGFRPRN